ncbi:unnamed protein product [Rotaria sp. Silwood2]|nr:unnamed protein product [Rotaria sp. Silwood2]CAF2842331.1 unnamed protein product [Rotaria sp. Silwood2]CAF3087853.1 unnamed protein product [Rotaria sp. Silwood2]CAF3258445.1 unnamed protein product [Rotaria sp. Silwood2]CAF3926717.1 unnamed protein product [Rotaria sp. Silwood2]
MKGSNKGGFQWQNWDLKTGYKTIQWRSTVSAPLCGFCNKTVFPAEEVIGAGQKFHQLCLKCTLCNTLLNSSNLNGHDKKIYCISCYRRQFGPRAISYGLGTTISTNIDTPPNSPNLSHIETNVDSHHYPRMTSTDSSTSHTSSDDDSRHSNSQINSMKYVDYITKQHSSLANLTSLKTLSISGNICPRCSKNVYLAEGIKAAGKSFHKRCYTCAHCKGSISGARYCEHYGELYDNNCYQRLFGPKGILLIGNKNSL